MATLDAMFTNLLRSNPFFGFLIQQFKLVRNDKLPAIMGVCIQGKTPILMYNTKMVSEMSNKKGVGVLEHECLHILLKHIGRAKNMHPLVANIAMDMEINQQIKWFIQYKNGNDKFEYCWPEPGWPLEMQFELYYDMIIEEIKKNSKDDCSTCGQPGDGSDKSEEQGDEQGDGSGSGNGNEPGDGSDKSEEQGDGSGSGEESNESDEQGDGQPGSKQSCSKCPDCGQESKYGKVVDDHGDWKDIDDDTKEELEGMVKTAIGSAQQAGQDLGAFSDIISNFFKVKENWQKMLKKYISNNIKTNHRFKLRQDRRRKTIPARVKGFGTEVVIGFDSSGSCMGDFDLFASQIKKIYEAQKKQSKFWVATCDMKVEINEFKGKKLKIDGGGGTDMRVLIDAIMKEPKLQARNKLVVLFTDGYTPWYSTNPYPGMKLLVVYTEDHDKMLGDGDWFKSIVIKKEQ